MNPLSINGRRVGPGHPAYLIAELSANHGGDYEVAVQSLHAAKKAGADAVKLQTYTADTLTIACDRDCFKIKGGTLWDGKTLHDLYGEAFMPWEWQPKLKKIADSIGLDLFSSAFDDTAVDFLNAMNVPAHKVASFEMVDHALIRKMAASGRPIIMSTGMATLDEIREAVDTAKQGGCRELALLKCTSAYPAPPEEMNLRTLSDLASRFGVPVGLSDHTLGIEVAVAAVALGACIIERHFSLSRSVPSADSSFSLEPGEFTAMVQAVRVVEKALGSARYEIGDQEQSSRAFRRSLFAVQDIKAGETLTPASIRSIRPGFGLPPKHLGEVLGRKARTDIPRGTPLSWDLLQ